jgi:hypothetical protein
MDPHHRPLDYPTPAVWAGVSPNAESDKKTPPIAMIGGVLVAGVDSNHRPPGYEPDEQKLNA